MAGSWLAKAIPKGRPPDTRSEAGENRKFLASSATMMGFGVGLGVGFGVGLGVGLGVGD
jgi:hypothetical protein